MLVLSFSKMVVSVSKRGGNCRLSKNKWPLQKGWFMQKSACNADVMRDKKGDFHVVSAKITLHAEHGKLVSVKGLVTTEGGSPCMGVASIVKFID